MSTDSIGHRRLRPESAFTFPEQAALTDPKPIEPHEIDMILKRFQLLEPRGPSLRSARDEACAHKLARAGDAHHRRAPQRIWIARIGSPGSKPLYVTAEVNREVGTAAALIIM